MLLGGQVVVVVVVVVDIKVVNCYLVKPRQVFVMVLFGCL